MKERIIDLSEARQKIEAQGSPEQLLRDLADRKPDKVIVIGVWVEEDGSELMEPFWAQMGVTSMMGYTTQAQHIARQYALDTGGLEYGPDGETDSS